MPEEANLIYRDAMIPGTAFKGVTVTWTHAPATITLNRATLPTPETTDPVEQELIRAVVTHETGHALGLGDVPAPGVNIRECANMLMKRSVDKGGGQFSETATGRHRPLLHAVGWSDLRRGSTAHRHAGPGAGAGAGAACRRVTASRADCRSACD